MYTRDSITHRSQQEKPVKRNISMLEYTEAQQARVEATDANQAHRAWLQAHGLGHIEPSELFAS